MEEKMVGENRDECSKGKKMDSMKNHAKKMRKFPRLVWTALVEVGRDDPRRLIHALKVGLALTLVSLLYLLEPLFQGIGKNAMWAVMTVVVVLEFTAGATLRKGLNRGLGTLLAGLLAFFIEYVAEASGRVLRAVFIGAAVFLIGAASAYIRFIPYIKKNYDYGVLIFLLTFNLITVSSYRVTNVLGIAKERFYTIAIGCGVCLCMSILVLPNWSGEELHNSIVSKLEGLSKSFQICVNEYFNDETSNECENEASEDLIYDGYMAVLHSKSNDETLALHASWEPRHLRHCKYPWQQYVKLGSAIRHFGYTIVALHGSLRSEIQTPRLVRMQFKDPCTRLASEVSKALNELADSIKNRRQWSPEILSEKFNEALRDLNIALKSQPRLFIGPNTDILVPKSGKDFAPSLSNPKMDNMSPLRDLASKDSPRRKVLRPTMSKLAITSLEFSEALPFAAFASLLLETVVRFDHIIEEAEELARIANFKEPKCGLDEVVVSSQRSKLDRDVKYSNADGGD